ncbi:hypothetical protein QJS10_CPB04g01754 [Acorus calamus]|uniref:Uncharacterized protein n=1 Tax=Acorus calamus TaxID=4465 RepID=A0AAV9EY88_ACOCL|nr:hypothetical protein QJS10_CPB04g01754 [Acorus calamus]
MSVEKEQVIFNDQLLAPRETSSARISQDNHHFNGYSSLKVNNAEGTSISILLKDKWPVLQGRTFNATTISYEDPSCARDGFMRNSLRQFSSASSSVDMSSSRNLEIQIQRQLSSRSLESSRKEPISKPKSSRLSLSRNSSKMSVDFEQIITMSMENFDEFSMKGDPVEEVLSTTTEGGDKALTNEDLSHLNSSFTTITVKEGTLDHPANCSTNDTPTSELIKHVQIAGSKDLSTTEYFRKEEHTSNPTLELIKHMQIAGQEDLSIIESLRNEDHISYINTDDFNHVKSSEEASVDIVESVSSEEDILMNNGVSGIDGSNVYTDRSLLENDCDRCIDLNAEYAVFSGLNNNMEVSREHYLSKDELISTSRSIICDSFHAIHESTVTIEGLRHKPRSITLEEATYAILFCSSIVHDLAYKAASIAMERESSASLEAICLTVTTINKPVPDRKDNTRSNRSSNKRKKTRRKRLDTETKTLPAKDKNDFKIQDPWMSKTETLNRIDTAKPPKLESKCNCTVM